MRSAREKRKVTRILIELIPETTSDQVTFVVLRLSIMKCQRRSDISYRVIRERSRRRIAKPSVAAAAAADDDDD